MGSTAITGSCAALKCGFGKRDGKVIATESSTISESKAQTAAKKLAETTADDKVKAFKKMKCPTSCNDDTNIYAKKTDAAIITASYQSGKNKWTAVAEVPYKAGYKCKKKVKHIGQFRRSGSFRKGRRIVKRKR